MSRILHLLPILPQPTESIWFPTIWSNTSPGKSNKYLYLSVHHLASLISASVQTYQCVFISLFLSDIMASKSEFVRCFCYHTEPTQNENLCLPCTLLKINIKSFFLFSKEQKIIITVGGLLLMYKIYLFCTHDFFFARELNKTLECRWITWVLRYYWRQNFHLFNAWSRET